MVAATLHIFRVHEPDLLHQVDPRSGDFSIVMISPIKKAYVLPSDIEPT
jgi:hypothetical protein